MISAIATPTTTALQQTIRQNPIGLSSIVQVQPRFGAGHDIFSDAPYRCQAKKSEYHGLECRGHVRISATVGWIGPQPS
jgi:hypothetical protein